MRVYFFPTSPFPRVLPHLLCPVLLSLEDGQSADIGRFNLGPDDGRVSLTADMSRARRLQIYLYSTPRCL